MNKTKKLRELEQKHISKGTPVMIRAPESMRVSKFNGRKGEIKRIKCGYNPIPEIELEDGTQLAVELKYLVIPQQTNLF